MRVDPADPLLRGARQAQQHMVYGEVGLGHDIIIVVHQQIVDVADLARPRVLDGQDRIVRDAAADGFHGLVEGLDIEAVCVRAEILQRRRVAVRALDALIYHAGFLPRNGRQHLERDGPDDAFLRHDLILHAPRQTDDLFEQLRDVFLHIFVGTLSAQRRDLLLLALPVLDRPAFFALQLRDLPADSHAFLKSFQNGGVDRIQFIPVVEQSLFLFFHGDASF